ncbi:MAG: hypothetical protein G3H99_04360 [Ferrovum sp.]|nr:hypothetical protein [Ferrovum sp.]NDU87182.1 hypothetical protein [Ferrovum sp.]
MMKKSVDSLRLSCGTRQHFERVLVACAGRILGVLAFGSVEPQCSNRQFPFLWVQQSVLGGETWFEVWVSTQRVTVSPVGSLVCAQDDGFIFGGLVLAEDGRDNLEFLAHQGYSAIFDKMDREGYPYLLRVWNYFPGINDTGRELERYREFNVGRHEAFSHKIDRAFEGGVPAACALGTEDGGLVLGFLASRVPGISLENPRQTRAYDYPENFGPKSPVFSRGMLVGNALFISGTASILGSETVYPGDMARQVDEMLINLRAVIKQAATYGFDAYGAEGGCFNVYLRYAEDYPMVRDKLSAEFPAADCRVYLQADICRADLLVEVEAFWIEGI